MELVPLDTTGIEVYKKSPSMMTLNYALCYPNLLTAASKLAPVFLADFLFSTRPEGAREKFGVTRRRPAGRPGINPVSDIG